MNQSRMPSAAFLVAVLALVAAVAGTAIAGPGASKISNTQLKQLVKKEVAKQIEKVNPAKAFTLTLDDETGNVVAGGFRLRFGADFDGFCDQPRIIALADDSYLWMTDEFGDNDDFDFDTDADIFVWDNGEQVTVDARTLDGSSAAQFEFTTREAVSVNGNDECIVTGSALSN